VVREADARPRTGHDALGMPPPPRAGGFPVTNIRNATSPHWRGWLKPESRCLVPANSFAEYALEPNPATGKKDVVWLALNDDRTLFAFGGLWTEFNGDTGPSRSRSPDSPCLQLSDHRAQCGRRTDPSQGHAGSPDDR